MKELKETDPKKDFRTARHRILLAEDNPHDCFLLEEAFSNANIAVHIECVPDGDQLLNRLREAQGGNSPFGLIVLDAHLPRRSAEEVLTAIQDGHDQLDIPVVVLSSLISEQEKKRFLELGVHSNLSKPLDLNEYLDLARNLEKILDGAR